MAAQLALANQHVCDDNPAAALIAFERSIQEAPTAAAYAGRAALHIRERRFTDALQDAAVKRLSRMSVSYTHLTLPTILLV